MAEKGGGDFKPAGRGRGRRISSGTPASPPPGPGSDCSQLTTISTIPKSSELASTMSKLTVEEDLEPMKRPDIGKAGRPMKLETNFFPLDILVPHLIMYRYEVEIREPPKVQGKGRGRIFTAAKQDAYDSEEARRKSYDIMRRCIDSNPEIFSNWAGIVYDRRRALFSLEMLKFKEKFQWKDAVSPYSVVTIEPAKDKEDPKNNIHVVKFGNVLDAMRSAFGSADRSVAQLLDIITSQFLYDDFKDATDKSTVYAPHGRQFYKPMNPAKELGFGRHAHEGFFKSVRTVMGNNPDKDPVVCLNVDSKKAPFFKSQPLLDTVRETLRINFVPQSLALDKIKLLTHHLKGLKVETSHTRKVYTIHYVSNASSVDYKFPDKNGQEVSIQQYMLQNYQIHLAYPNLPCVISRIPNQNPAYLPMELLVVLPYQKVDLKKSTSEQSKQMIALSAVKPTERREEILAKVKCCGAGDNDPYCKKFGIKRNPDMMKVAGRILTPPQVLMMQRSIPVSRGQWDARQAKAILPASIRTWAAVTCFGEGREIPARKIGQLEEFLIGIRNGCVQLGISIPEKPGNMRSLNSSEEIPAYFKFCAQNEFDLVVCFIEGDSETRNLIKYHGDVEYNITTQCIKKETLKKASIATFTNIAYKINSKSGGINNGVVDTDTLVKGWLKKEDGVMYIGFDVSHPPALSQRELRQGMVPKEPSVVGAAANVEGSVEKFLGHYFLQTSRQEEITEEIMHACMEYFITIYRKNHGGNPPAKVVVYRDGVSESQYDMVLRKETAALKRALGALCSGRSIPVTVLVTQKRHHTRFFPIGMNPNAKSSEQNIPAGTVVDTGPVSPSLFDFYLCSHTGLQGTSKATKYVVLKDENGFNADTLQRVTFVLAHLYQRCTKSVSLPAPVYFAHHIATRGKECYDAYVRGGRDDSSSGIGSDGGGGGDMPDLAAIQAKIHREGNKYTLNMAFL